MNNMIGPDLPETPETETPPLLAPATPPATIPWGRWLRGFLATNPFYLLSAALLLYGIYRVSTGPGVFASETAQLAFNFGALQFYEMLLVGTAILLARRAVWYDATLLAAVENALVFVPFMLVTQAALIEQTWVWGCCGAGVALAATRAGAARAWLRNLNLPARALGCGALVLAFNAALPVMYRHLHESKYGTKLAEGAAYAFNEWSWLALLPAVMFSALLLPQPRATGELWPQRRWLPSGFFLLWLTATITHLYSLGYVYDFDLRRELVAPGLWALAWITVLRVGDFIPAPGAQLRHWLFLLPVATPLVAGVANNRITLALAALNAVAYVAAALIGHQPRLARNLAIASVLMIIAAIPHHWGAVVIPGFNPLRAVGAAVLAGLILPALLSRNPKLGLLGALAAAVAVGNFIAPELRAMQWATQTGCAFLLLHSLSWEGHDASAERVVRWGVVLGWLAHAIVWSRVGEPGFVLAGFGLLVFAAWTTAYLLGWVRGLRLIPYAALLVIVVAPVNHALVWMTQAPAGVTAMLGSLLLFALGTAAALTKHRWHKWTADEEPLG
jgi:hypothetical protein